MLGVMLQWAGFGFQNLLNQLEGLGFFSFILPFLLLFALILAGAFIPDTNKEYSWVFFGIGVAIFIIVMISAFSDWQFIGSNWWYQYGGLIIVLVVVIGAI